MISDSSLFSGASVGPAEPKSIEVKYKEVYSEAWILTFVEVVSESRESTKPAETRLLRPFKAKIEGANPSGVTTVDVYRFEILEMVQRPFGAFWLG